MSEKYPALIIQQLVSEYCSLNQVTIEEVLMRDKHELYHKRMETDPCCQCNNKIFCTYIKVISEKQWRAFYEMNARTETHSCPLDFKKCSERFVPKNINTRDLSVTIPLLLNSENMLHHIISQLGEHGLTVLLMNAKHTIYHAVHKLRCCMCCVVSIEQQLINKKEWNILFKKDNNIPCYKNYMDCCCQYSVRENIQYTDMDDTSWCKILYVAGPFSLLSFIEECTFLSFLNWNVDDRPLERALTELLSMIQDEKFFSDMSQRISSRDHSADKEDAYEWVSKHLQHQKVCPDVDQTDVIFKLY